MAKKVRTSPSYFDVIEDLTDEGNSLSPGFFKKWWYYLLSMVENVIFNKKMS